MKKIFKYQLETTSVQEIEMPEAAEVLTVQIQNEVPCIWVLVEPNSAVIKRTFEIFGTGYDVPENVNRKYIGTYQHYRGVFHCFEILAL